MKARVWLYPGKSGWHFCTLPKKESGKIKENSGEKIRGWGSIPVKATIGKTSWETSIFRDKKSQSYLLPLKSEVREKEKIKAGDKINFVLEINNS